ncbi:hypothetical protein R1sor_018750 [Riccia sorocarpa]|uniref:Uncharacterized protein n=1 Tax=Riccia sorocarpa TaxID=122646 RepID=A0ABD3IAN5_9MARC
MEKDTSEDLPPPPMLRPPGMPPPESSRGPPSARPQPSSANAQEFSQMRRNGFGSKGAKCDLEVNHFKVKFRPREEVYHYNVTIEPATKRPVCRKVMTKLYEIYGQQTLMGKKFAYDGEKSLFTVGPLPFSNKDFQVLLDDDPGRGPRRIHVEREEDRDDDGRPAQRRRAGGRDFEVKIEFAAKVNMKAIDAVLRGERDETAQDALRVLDIMLREHAARRDYLLIRDCFFHKSLGPVGEIGEGVQSWRGYHVSFRPSSGGCLTLNFDLSTTTVIKPLPVLLFIQEHCKKDIRSFQDADWQRAKRVLKGIIVETYAGRKQKVIGFSPRACNQTTFSKRSKNGDEDVSVVITVADYFAIEKKLTLSTSANLPCIDVGKSNKPVYLPIELCKIVEGQRYKKSLSGVQRKNHIDQARQTPEERRKIVQEAMNVNNYNENELVKEFSVQIDQKMARVQGRILEPPSLVFGNREEKPSNGRWNFNSKKMKVGVTIEKWAVANFTRFPAEPIARQLQTVCGQKGMVMLNPFSQVLVFPSAVRFSVPVILWEARGFLMLSLIREHVDVQRLGEIIVVDEKRHMANRSAEDRVSDMLFQQLKQHKPKFVLAVLPEKSSELYAPFKRTCETVIGIVTQCIVPPRNVKDQYLTNVALKINLKWGGYNTVLSQEEKKMLPKVSAMPTVIFGLDVSHGSPGDANSPSIAAAVASMHWPFMSQYAPRVRAQPAKTEMIQGLFEMEDGKPGGMVIELLKDFYSTCRGAADRKPKQIVIYRDGVSESQFEQVLEKELVAFTNACDALESGYRPRITLIVVQKRHHTRFFPARGSGNVKPGTIVDTDVCHPRDNDFFLMSHAGIIGTTRPTHYHVLYDEIGFSPDEVQHLTHSLCYSYARCTSAVSVAAPAYYAHLAAQHCRNFLDADHSGSESSSMSGRPGAVQRLPKLNADLNTKMFYA